MATISDMFGDRVACEGFWAAYSPHTSHSVTFICWVAWKTKVHKDNSHTQYKLEENTGKYPGLPQQSCNMWT